MPSDPRKKAEAAKSYAKKIDTTTVETEVDAEILGEKWFKEGEWRPAWADVQFDGDACLTNVLKNPKDGFYAPAGTVLPLGAQMPEMTVLKYGGYIPEGTSFPGGVMIPLHARMVNLLPQQTKKPSPPSASESLCLVQ